jgi:hypothetical protein
MTHPDTIFIVDEPDMPRNTAMRKPGDTTPFEPTAKPMPPAAAERSGKLADVLTIPNIPGASPLVSRAIVGAAVGGLMVTGPMALVLAAATAGAGAYSAFSDGKEAASKQRLEHEAYELQRFLEMHAVTPKLARELGFQFAPGHPRIGVQYRMHPLAEIPESGLKNLYIPEDSFNQTLLDERESELLKLLVELGATRITISERVVRANASSLEAEASTSSVTTGDTGASVKLNEKQTDDQLGSRHFELVGKPSTSDHRIDETAFTWLPYEPSWKSLVRARQVGQCTRAVVELKQETAFSSESQLSLQLKLAAYGGAIKAAKALSAMTSRSYVFQVDFAPFAGASRPSVSDAAT